jgi:hypothetical protein
MTRDAESMLEDLTTRITELGNDQPLMRTEKTLELIAEALRALKTTSMAVGFTSQEDEIHFHKRMLPQFNALFIYHAAIYTIEFDKPVDSEKSLRRYLRSELRKIENYFLHNADLFKYYKSGRTEHDEEYFTKNNRPLMSGIDTISPLIDKEFTTIFSIKIAFLLAYEQLKTYVSKLMNSNAQGISPSFSVETDTPLNWTDSKVAFVELCYALHATGVFNNGNVGVQRIITNLAGRFGIEVSNPSRVFQEILARKKGRLVLLNRMIASSERRMDRDDL